MLQGIRPSPLSMPSFGHNLSLTGAQKMDNYPDIDPWSWSSQQSNPPSQAYNHIFDPSLYNFNPQPAPTPPTVQPRHHSIATSHVMNTSPSVQSHAATPPPPRHQQQVSGTLVKAQPVFKPTWHGFLDTTKDAMTIVEAALQGRLSHISRRPHDKERAEMLTSGTVLVYEENASGIKRWTDAVHWSPSRVMNNCLIYRQLVRALKPEEKRSALNPSCGTKRKRKESASPSMTNTGENVNNAEDEYEHSAFDNISADPASADKVYANFAQTLTPDQQRRFCGSLIDSYEFKEGGLMKKTISVKYNGTHHHIISYYSLEDVVNGKLKRPTQDPKLADIIPRPELLTGWKVSLEDEENKDLPLITGYSQHPIVGTLPQGIQPQALVQSHPPLHLQVPSEYWPGPHVQQYNAPHHSPQHYVSPQHSVANYATHAPQTQQPSQHPTQPAPSQSYTQQPSSQQYTSQPAPTPQYSYSVPNHYASQPRANQHYISEQDPRSAQQQYPQQVTPSYPPPQHSQVPHQTQFAVPHSSMYDMGMPAPPPQSHTPVQHSPHDSVPQPQPLHQDSQRRASAPVAMQTYGHAPSQQYPSNLTPQNYYVPDAKFSPNPGFGY